MSACFWASVTATFCLFLELSSVFVATIWLEPAVAGISSVVVVLFASIRSDAALSSDFLFFPRGGIIKLMSGKSREEE